MYIHIYISIPLHKNNVVISIRVNVVGILNTDNPTKQNNEIALLFLIVDFNK